jgi:hypothetical protein
VENDWRDVEDSLGKYQRAVKAQGQPSLGFFMR